MSNLENAVIKHKIIANRSLMADIVMFTILEISIIGYFMAAKFNFLSNEVWSVVVVNTLMLGLILMAFKRIYDLFLISGHKELGSEMVKRIKIMIGMYCSSMVMGLILFLIYKI